MLPPLGGNTLIPGRDKTRIQRRRSGPAIKPSALRHTFKKNNLSQKEKREIFKEMMQYLFLMSSECEEYFPLLEDHQTMQKQWYK